VKIATVTVITAGFFSVFFTVPAVFPRFSVPEQDSKPNPGRADIGDRFASLLDRPKLIDIYVLVGIDPARHGPPTCAQTAPACTSDLHAVGTIV